MDLSPAPVLAGLFLSYHISYGLKGKDSGFDCHRLRPPTFSGGRSISGIICTSGSSGVIHCPTITINQWSLIRPKYSTCIYRRAGRSNIKSQDLVLVGTRWRRKVALESRADQSLSAIPKSNDHGHSTTAGLPLPRRLCSTLFMQNSSKDF